MKERINVAFVILHYNEIEVTRASINCIKSLECFEYGHIVVVDNCSPDNSGELLVNEYVSDPYVTVLKTTTNLGFAKGNNFGYKYIKDNYDVCPIVVMNNDVMIQQKDFITALLSMSPLNEYEILMPQIINKEGINQNPFRTNQLSTIKVLGEFINLLLLRVIYAIPVINEIWSKRKKSIIPPKKDVDSGPLMVPHGACVIFTPKWVVNEQNAFVPDTFLYGEEDLLFEYAYIRDYKTFYTKTLWVKHLEDVSTDSVIKRPIEKSKFLIKNLLFSQWLLLKMRLKKLL